MNVKRKCRWSCGYFWDNTLCVCSYGCTIALKIFLHEILFCLISVPASRSNQEDKSSQGTLTSAQWSCSKSWTVTVMGLFPPANSTSLWTDSSWAPHTKTQMISYMSTMALRTVELTLTSSATSSFPQLTKIHVTWPALADTVLTTGPPTHAPTKFSPCLEASCKVRNSYSAPVTTKRDNCRCTGNSTRFDHSIKSREVSARASWFPTSWLSVS